jgi:hypothetical protein
MVLVKQEMKARKNPPHNDLETGNKKYIKIFTGGKIYSKKVTLPVS